MGAAVGMNSRRAKSAAPQLIGYLVRCTAMNRAFVVILSCAALLGCEEKFDEESDRALLAKMEQDIVSLIGEPRCQNDNACRFIAFGAKPCGGPWRYLIYSVETVDRALLEDRVAAYNDFNSLLNRRYRWYSDCSVPSIPIVGCRDSTCVDVGHGP